MAARSVSVVVLHFSIPFAQMFCRCCPGFSFKKGRESQKGERRITDKRNSVGSRGTLKPSNFNRGENMFKHIWKYVWLMVAMSMALAACATPPAAPAVVTEVVAGTPVVVTVTPAPTANPYDDNAP